MAAEVRRRTQAERRATTRADLLEAAKRLTADRGFAQTSLADIAEAAGVSKGAIYHHFASKDDLLLALLDAHFHERIEAVDRITSAEGMVEEIPFDRRWNLLFLEFVVRAARDEVFGRKLRQRLERLRERSTEGMEKFLKVQGIETVHTSEEMVTGMAALGNGLAIEALMNPDVSTDPLYTSMLALLLRGLQSGA